MDYHNETTTLPGRELSPWQDLGAASARTCSPPPSRGRKTVPKAIHEIVGELKVRFQHTCGGDPEGFRARVGFLAEDLADSPPLLLRKATVEWVREHPFLPTASDLIGLMRGMLEARDQADQVLRTKPGEEWEQAYCDQRNAKMAANPEGRQDVEWVMVNGRSQLVAKHRPAPAPPPPPEQERIPRADIDTFNRNMRKFGLGMRCGRDGRTFTLKPGAADPTVEEPNS